jgi:hypothetical protein
MLMMPLRSWIALSIGISRTAAGTFAPHPNAPDISLRRDLEAVELSIATPWSNGPIDGHINRLKAIKRQMHGRAAALRN